jgi:hypothetical protein
MIRDVIARQVVFELRGEFQAPTEPGSDRVRVSTRRRLPTLIVVLPWPSPQFIVGTGLCTLALTSIYCRDRPLQLDQPSPLLGDLRPLFIPGDIFLTAIVVFPLLLTVSPLTIQFSAQST